MGKMERRKIGKGRREWKGQRDRKRKEGKSGKGDDEKGSMVKMERLKIGKGRREGKG